MTNHYETITSRIHDLDKLSKKAREAFHCLFEEYAKNPDWEDYSITSQKILKSALKSIPTKKWIDHPLYKISQDLELRLGIDQKKVAQPDYRDFLLDRIEEQFGTRYRFCKETGISEAVLSQVLSGRKNFSLAKLRELADYLGFAITLMPLKSFREPPVSDLTALRKVSQMVNEELARLYNLKDHLTRIEQSEKRTLALKNEREMYPTVIDKILAKVEKLSVEKQGDEVLEFIKEEFLRLQTFNDSLKIRIAQAIEPEQQSGRSNETPLSGMLRV